MRISNNCNPPLIIVLAALMSRLVSASELANTTWRITLSSNRLGPVEILMKFEDRGDTLHAFSSSGAFDHILEFPGAQDPSLNLEEALLHFTLSKTAAGYQGETVSPRLGIEVSLKVGENGALGVRPVVDLIAAAAPRQDAGRLECAEFTLHCPRCRPRDADDLADVELLIGPAE